MIQGLSVSASGMTTAALRMAAGAHNVAALNAEPPVVVSEVESSALPRSQGVISNLQTRESILGVDLVSEVLSLKLSMHAFAANASAAAISFDTLGALVNLLDTDTRAR